MPTLAASTATTRTVGSPAPGGAQDASGTIGRTARLAAIRATCSAICARGRSSRAVQYA